MKVIVFYKNKIDSFYLIMLKMWLSNSIIFMDSVDLEYFIF